MQIVALDTETHLIKPGCVAPKLVCVSTACRGFDGSVDYELFNAKHGLIEARDILERGEMVGHHVFYDLCVLAAEDLTLLPLIYAAIDEGRIHCTKIRQMIIDNGEGELKFKFNEETNEYNRVNFTLKTLVWRHLNKTIEKGEDTWRLRYNELDGVPLGQWPEDARAYAIGDAVDTLAVYEAQEVYCEPYGLPGGPEGEISQTKAAWALYLMGAWGVRTDKDRVVKLKEEITKEHREHFLMAQKWKFIRKGKKETRNIKAIQGAVQTWYNKHEKSILLTDGGKISTRREVLTEVECDSCGFMFGKCDCGGEGIHQGLWAVAEVVRLGKLLSTYIPALERGTSHPINPSYNPIIETFRTSCSQGMKIDGIPMGANLQNPPRKSGVRECFVPRPGSVFVFCDYDTLEMLTLAQVCLELFGYSHIGEAAHAGQDFHIALAADMMEISYDEALQRHREGDEEVKNARQYCKIGNYGFGGGMGPHAFVSYAKGMGIEVKLAHAMKLHQGFRDKWREMKDYFAYCGTLTGDAPRAEWIEFPRSKLMRGNVTYTAICNGFFQHRAAMGAKAALYEVSKECYVDKSSALYGCRPWLFAHDEIGMEVPYTGQRASDAAYRLQAIMVKEMKTWCPDMPIAATAAMSRRWYKGCEAVFAPEGYMIPSKPEGKGWVVDAGV
jgi:hypothetical protein